MKKIFFINAVFLLTVFFGYAQDSSILLNKGVMYVSSKTIVSSTVDLENSTTGEIYNDGTLYLNGNLKNDGILSFTEKLKAGYTVFESSKDINQQITGKQAIDFYDVLFNRKTESGEIELKTKVFVSGKANFFKGVLKINKEQDATLSFKKGSEAINASDDSYAEGKVLKIGNNNFAFPIGKKGHYGYAGILAPKKVLTAIQGEYFYKNSNVEFPHSSKIGLISAIHDQEYWELSNTTNDERVVLTLGWNEETIAASFLENEGKGLGIVRWDNEQKAWVHEGGIVDLGNKTVTLPVAVSNFGVFTLGKLKTELVLAGDVVIYNAVSPNGDGVNDYFRIENLDRCSNNKVTIFNRWGVQVYKTTNYGANGNVFSGISEGRGTLNSKDALPTGTYYYILEYEYISQGESNRIKKAGYLHLENN